MLTYRGWSQCGVGVAVVADFGQSNFGQSIFVCVVVGVLLLLVWVLVLFYVVCFLLVYVVVVCYCVLLLVSFCCCGTCGVCCCGCGGGSCWWCGYWFGPTFHRTPPLPPPDRPKFRAFFPSPTTSDALFSLSQCVFSLNFGGFLKGPGPNWLWTPTPP